MKGFNQTLTGSGDFMAQNMKESIENLHALREKVKFGGGMKKQEAFQRALLSARIANDAKAKIFGDAVSLSSSSYETAQPSSLTHIVQRRNKPTLSQQKAFANNNRRTSLFPEKTESHLLRLLQK